MKENLSQGLLNEYVEDLKRTGKDYFEAIAKNLCHKIEVA